MKINIVPNAVMSAPASFNRKTLYVRFAHLRGGLYKEAALLQICSNGHSTIVHECNRCPLCALTEHNNTVHDFIESNGRGLVSELVAYQHRKAAEQVERPANVTQQVKTPAAHAPDWEICPVCNGKGWTPKNILFAAGDKGLLKAEIKEYCSSCNGSGKLLLT